MIPKVASPTPDVAGLALATSDTADSGVFDRAADVAVGGDRRGRRHRGCRTGLRARRRRTAGGRVGRSCRGVHRSGGRRHGVRGGRAVVSQRTVAGAESIDAHRVRGIFGDCRPSRAMVRRPRFRPRLHPRPARSRISHRHSAQAAKPRPTRKLPRLTSSPPRRRSSTRRPGIRCQVPRSSLRSRNMRPWIGSSPRP